MQVLLLPLDSAILLEASGLLFVFHRSLTAVEITLSTYMYCATLNHKKCADFLTFKRFVYCVASHNYHRKGHEAETN